ncbi:ABC transporter ATP-binding protein [Methanogenium organophilum]|uniref:ABC transporter ATP-binding protein n=1 Tax=Methanogenium organophilum TaxID=2199 RepID=A0A9X9S1S5_METOG|nr:ABC transporter ATP-binding protein [Methanogenium organophilum]WAI00273.1 ABC transporter ATP-binding protein [Methanogenium organophilum]
MGETILETIRLVRTYGGGVQALNGVSIRVPKGECTAIVGKSGSGKSTLMNIIGCLDAPTSGEVRIRGIPVDYTDTARLIDLRRNEIGFVFQQFNLIPHLSAQENVEYPLLFSYRPEKERQESAAALLARVGLEHRGSHYPGELSGGEQQRVAIARSLINGPAVVLADEPTGNLDSRTSDDILDLIYEINRTEGTTFLIVTHDADLGKRADRMITIHDGRVVD